MLICVKYRQPVYELSALPGNPAAWGALLWRTLRTHMHKDGLAPVEPLPVLFSEKDLCHWLKLSRQSLAAMVSRGAFPAPIRVGLRRKAWSKTEIANWFESRRGSASDGQNGR